MQNPVRVELVPLMVPVSEDVYAKRELVVERLAGLGHIDAASGEVSELTQAGWLARINGVEVPVLAYGIEPAEAGARALVSLVVPADSVSIGDSSTGTGEPSVRPSVPEVKKVSSWGAPGRPDPREGIPGWKPETDEPVKVEFRAGLNDRVIAGIRERTEHADTGAAEASA